MCKAYFDGFLASAMTTARFSSSDRNCVLSIRRCTTLAVGVNLICGIPETYPDAVPDMSIEVTSGLLQAQASEIEELAAQTASENVGMVMGYTIAEAVRDWLLEHNISQEDGSMHANMLRRMDANTKRDRAEIALEEVSTANTRVLLRIASWRS